MNFMAKIVPILWVAIVFLFGDTYALLLCRRLILGRGIESKVFRTIGIAVGSAFLALVVGTMLAGLQFPIQACNTAGSLRPMLSGWTLMALYTVGLTLVMFTKPFGAMLEALTPKRKANGQEGQVVE